MTRKVGVFATVSMLLLIGLLSVTLRVGPVAAVTITVPDDYPTIQEAINHASQGDVIFVRNGTYHENIHINKTLTIIGENRSNTVVDGYGVSIDHSDAVTITGFTIRNATRGIFLASSQHCRIYKNNILGNSGSAIFMFSCRNAVVFGNAITNNGEGISIVGASYNTISENFIADTTGSGVRLGVGDEWASFNNISGNTIKGHEYGITFSGSYGNRIFGNNITGNNFGLNLRSGTSPCGNTYNDISENNIDGNSYGLYLYTGDHYFQSGFSKIFGNNIANNSVCGVYLGERSNNNTVLENDLKSNTVGLCIYKASNNTLYHNNFIQNAIQANSCDVNTWDNGCEGNFWSDYNGSDTDSDGLGDTYLPWQGLDYYPLINPYWNPADVNHDLRVDIKDLVYGAKAYGSYLGHQNWDPRVDVNNDGKIDIEDLAIMAKSYGKTYLQ